MAVVHMAQFVREDAGDLVRALRLLQQRVEQVDFSAWQCDGVRDLTGHYLGIKRMLDPARGPDLPRP